ncbi:MAG: restriction endonuclease subunit S [Sulfuricurvum sp.]|jgi:restriction endonuclease S subunit|uniref:restriction endonuclease subunit S n=1 Tax=Sulfuricurvum sp. TaxID=2025608 RepID=UPI0025EFD910|nr:restriction endonuclease subunit S [Sulfuricurvum sp.]MCK9372165.1 restriction endonuclease subunit S [Sulfuricurvum sp.]
MSELYKLTNLIDFIGGSQPPKSTFSEIKKDGYVRLIQIRDYKSDNYIVYIPEDSTKKFCTKDEIMIGRYGPPVFQILRGIEGAYNVALMKAKPKIDELSSEYLFRFLQNPSIQNYIIGLSQRSAGQSGINKEALEEYEMLLPSLSEQQRIVSKLDLLFAKIDKSIELHQKNMDEADAFMGSVLNEVFDRHSVLDTESTINQWIPNQVRDDEKWEKNVLLKDITSKIGSGATPSGGQKAYKTEGISLIRSMNVHDYGFRFKNLAFIDDTQAKKLSNVTVEANDVLLNITGASVARCCIVDESILPARVNQHVSIIRLKNDMLPKFLHYYLISPSIKSDLLFSSSGGATREAITKSMIESFIVPLPPLQIQQKVVDYLDSVSEKMEKVKSIQKEKMESLKELKSSILDKAFRGEL